MAVYNGQRFLAPAIESILDQTFADFEYILVDDASTDSSPQIIRRYAARDARIIVVRNPSNLKQSGALNRALGLARGEYVANLDADDLALPERLARQVAYLDAHPEVGVVGAQVQLIDVEGQPLRLVNYPTTAELSRWLAFFQTPVLHSAAMIRRSLVVQAGGYAADGWYASDYVLAARLLRTTCLVNLPEVLALYRSHGAQTTSVFRKLQHGQVLLLIHSMLVERLGFRLGLDDIGLLYRAVRGEQLPDEAALLQAANLLGVLYARYVQVERLDGAALESVTVDCAWRWLKMAWAHRRTQRAASREILRRIETTDARFWQRKQTRVHLRQLVKAG